MDQGREITREELLQLVWSKLTRRRRGSVAARSIDLKAPCDLTLFTFHLPVFGRDLTMPLSGGISGFLIDLDGTIVEGGELIPGAPEALNALIQRGIPFRIVTNTTSKPRSAILAKMHTLGIDLAREQLITGRSSGAITCSAKELPAAFLSSRPRCWKTSGQSSLWRTLRRRC